MSSDTMTAAVFEGAGVLNIKEMPVPVIEQEDQVLVRVLAVSICGTDVRGLANPPQVFFKEGVIIGHECVGIVAAVGKEVSNAKVGDRVVVHPNQWCGKCHYCRLGRINLCDNFKHVGDSRDGAMADYLCVPEKLVYTISESVPVNTACLVEPLACVLNATTSVRAHPGENVLILGGGAIGMIFMLLYKAAGAKVFISDISANRREFALGLGADGVIDPSQEDINKFIAEKTVIGADIVVDAVGILLPEASTLVRKGGDIILFGLNANAREVMNQMPAVINEVTIHGKFIARGTFPLAISIIENNVIPISKLVTHEIPLQDTMKGLDMVRSGEAVKVIVKIADA